MSEIMKKLKKLKEKWKNKEITHIEIYDMKFSELKILSFVFDGKFSGVETEYGFIGMWHIKM